MNSLQVVRDDALKTAVSLAGALLGIAYGVGAIVLSLRCIGSGQRCETRCVAVWASSYEG